MFGEATAFNQPLNFNTSSVTSMYWMFCRATAFNQAVLFDTSIVTDMTLDTNFQNQADKTSNAHNSKNKNPFNFKLYFWMPL